MTRAQHTYNKYFNTHATVFIVQQSKLLPDILGITFELLSEVINFSNIEDDSFGNRLNTHEITVDFYLLVLTVKITTICTRDVF